MAAFVCCSVLCSETSNHLCTRPPVCCSRFCCFADWTSSRNFLLLRSRHFYSSCTAGTVARKLKKQRYWCWSVTSKHDHHVGTEIKIHFEKICFCQKLLILFIHKNVITLCIVGIIWHIQLCILVSLLFLDLLSFPCVFMCYRWLNSPLICSRGRAESTAAAGWEPSVSQHKGSRHFLMSH